MVVISQAPSVTRLNNAPVHSFERDVGSRTTIRLTYPEGAPHSSNEYRKTSIFAVVVFKSLDLDWLTSVITKQPLVRPHHKILHCTRKGHIAHRSITESHAAMALYYLLLFLFFNRASGPKCGSGRKLWIISPWHQRASRSSTQRLFTRWAKL